MPPRVRSLYAYELHGHDSRGVLDYPGFFGRMADRPRTDRSYTIGSTDEVVAIPEMQRMGDASFEMRFVIGRAGDLAVFYDMTTGAEREAEPGRNEVSVQSAWLWVDSLNRVVVQERKRPGVPLDLAARALAGIGRSLQLAPNPTISFMPLVEESFVREIDELARIRSASIVLSKPNAGWKNSAKSLLAAYADESNVGSVEFGASARPKESLSKDSGVVGDIKEMVSEDYQPLKNARIIGTRAGEQNERTVSMSKHAKKREVDLPEGASRAEEYETVRSGGLTYLAELASSHGPEESGDGPNGE